MKDNLYKSIIESINEAPNIAIKENDDWLFVEFEKEGLDKLNIHQKKM